MDFGGKRAIFLHGMWRSGSTYVWSRFRELNQTYCYYEPLHPRLGRLHANNIAKDTQDVMEANAHPRMASPYFEEFGPLINRRGVRGYCRRLAYHPYVLTQADEDPLLERHISSLIEIACQMGRRPVLGFNRSCLRLAWLRSRFSAWHLYIDRDPLDILGSYCRHVGQGNYDYFTAWMLTIEKNAKYPIFRPLAERISLRLWPLGRLIKPKRYYPMIIDQLSEGEIYFLVHYMWVVCALHSLSYCDEVLDMNGDNRASITKAIQEQVALPVSFETLKLSAIDESKLSDWQIAVEDEVRSTILQRVPRDFFEGAEVRRKLRKLSPRKAQVLESYL